MISDEIIINNYQNTDLIYMSSEAFKDIPLGTIQEINSGIDIERVTYQQKNLEDQYVTTVTKSGRLRYKKKKIKGHKPSSSYLVRLNLPDISEMPTIRPFSGNDYWCQKPSVFCKSILYSLNGVNKTMIDIIILPFKEILNNLILADELWKPLLDMIIVLLDDYENPFVWNPFPKIPLDQKYSFYWLLVFRISMLEYISTTLNHICYLKSEKYNKMVNAIGNIYVDNTPCIGNTLQSNMFYNTHDKSLNCSINIIINVLNVNLVDIFKFNDQDRLKSHSVYEDNDNIQLWRCRELEYNITLLLHTHIPVIINIGKLIQYENDKQNESSSLVKINYLSVDYSKYLIVWLESDDLVRIAIDEWYSEDNVIHEGSLYDISSFMMKTKICGDQDSDKIRIVKLLNKIMPIKCMSRNLGSILTKSITANPTIFYIINTMIQCTVLGLYRRSQNTRYSLSTRIKLFNDYVMTSINNPSAFKEVYGKETNPKFPLIRFAMKENVVFMAKLVTGLRDKLESEFNTIWKRFENIVIDNIEKLKISIQLCGTNKDFLVFLNELFDEQMTEQKDIIYRPHKRDLVTVITTTMDSILLNYYAEILLKQTVGVKPSKTVIGSIGIDRDNDIIYNPTVEQIYGIDRLSDIYNKIDTIFKNFTHMNVVSVTSLDMFGIHNKTIQKLTLMINEYEVQPMETQVERTLRSILRDPIQAHIDFPEREFLIIRKFFHVMHRIVSVRSISLPKHYRDNQIIALKRRYKIHKQDDNELNVNDIENTIGSILYCPNCNNIRSPITTDINNNFKDYGNSMQVTDILNTSCNDSNILCFCRPKTHIKLLEQKLAKTNNTIQEAFINCNKDNIIRNFDLQNAEDFDDLGNMTESGISKKKEKKEKNRGKHVTVNPIEHLFKTKANILFSIWKHKRCSKTSINRIPMIGKILFLNNNMYIICPRCGVYTIYAAERLKGGFVTCGVCDKMLSDNLLKRIISNNTMLDNNTKTVMNKLKILNIDNCEASKIYDMLMLDVYQNKIECIFGCKCNTNALGWCLLYVINDTGNIDNIDIIHTYEYDDRLFPIVRVYICKQHSTKFVHTYSECIKTLHDENEYNYPYPLLSMLLEGIDKRWFSCELVQERDIDNYLTIDTEFEINECITNDIVSNNSIIMYGPIKIFKDKKKLVKPKSRENQDSTICMVQEEEVMTSVNPLLNKRGRKPKI